MDYDFLKLIQANGFMKTDNDHPPGQGKPGYRAVYKTLKLLPLPGAQLTWPNLKVQMKLDCTTKGGLKINGALPSRRPNVVIMPEYIDEVKENGGTKFTGRTNMKFEFKAWEEKIDESGLVEILLLTDSSSPQDILNEGRLAIDKMKVILELAGGERLLGLPIAEEAVELFSDWHWNRSMSSLYVGTESELDIERLDTGEFFKKIKPAIERTQEFSIEERNRLAIASSWYWKAESEPDPVNRLIEYWTAIEALEMPNTTNIKPVKVRLEEITGMSADKCKRVVGKLYGLRCNLVHGKELQVLPTDLKLIRYMLMSLLYYRIFSKSDHRVIEHFIKLTKQHS